MTAPIASAPTVARLQVRDAELHYEVRGRGPLLVLVGCPMDAAAFALLAEQLATDHTVITTDPRGINRSTVADPGLDVTPELLAEDLSHLLSHLNAGPAAVFGSSGGAVSALALALAHPEQVHTVIAHEPPLDELLDDRDQLRVETEDIVATYLAGDIAGAWAKFLAQANIVLTEDEMSMGWPGEPDPQAVADELFFFAHTLRPTTWWHPDLQVLRTVSTRIVVGLGDASAGQSCERTSNALAAGLGITPTSFPGGHIGFVENPIEFAARLRTVLQAH